jgi:hypothetical protein
VRKPQRGRAATEKNALNALKCLKFTKNLRNLKNLNVNSTENTEGRAMKEELKPNTKISEEWE